MSEIGISEHTVLVLTAFLISFFGGSLLFELWLGFGSSLVIVAASVDVLKSFSETIFDGHDFSGSLVQEIVHLRLYLRIGLPIILLKLDLRNSILNLFDKISESQFSRLISIIRSSNFLRLFDMILLLNSDSFLLDNRFSGLLLTSHLVNISSHLIKFLVEHFDDFLRIVLVNEIKKTLDDGITKLIRKFFYRVIDILSFESFLECIKTSLISQDSLNFLGVFLWNFLSIFVLFGLIDGIVGNTEVSQKSVSSYDLLLLGISIGSTTFFSSWLFLVEFRNNIRKFVLDSLVLLKSSSESSTLGFKLPQIARQLLVGRTG